MQKLTISKRLFIIVAVLLAFLLLVAGESFFSLNTIKNNIEENQLDGLMATKEIEHLNWMAKVSNAIIDQNINSLDIQTDDHKCSFGKWLYGTGREKTVAQVPSLEPLLKAIEISHKNLHQSAIAIHNSLASHDRQLAHKIFQEQTIPAVQETQLLFNKIRKESSKFILTDNALIEKATSARRNIILFSCCALLVGGMVAIILGKQIITVINTISNELSKSSNDVTLYANQFSASSHQLANGATEQAASVEETSASLEEIASMTRQNAETTKHANRIMQETMEIMTKADTSMHDLTKAMQNISDASEKTSKVIQTIDEIAFQTNLLALNAAVEAARAGEAGAGFAVVADEVRNLAMRAAEAANNTSTLIDGTKVIVEQGEKLVHETGENFNHAITKSKEIATLFSEINTASQEQFTGISQISIGVTEIDSLTQIMAATAEESDSGAMELNSSSLKLDQLVQKLKELTTGQPTSTDSLEIASE